MDATAIFVSGYIGYYVYPGWDTSNQSAYFNALVVNLLLTVALFYDQGLYRIDAIYHPVRQFRKILLICAAVPLMLFGVAFAFRISGEFAHFWWFEWIVIFTVSIYIARLLAYFVIDFFVRRGWLRQYVAIVGGEANGERLIRHLESRKEPWMQIVGVFDDRHSRIPARVGQYDVLGNLSELVQYAQIHRVDDVLVALPWSADARVVDIVHTLSPLPVRVRLCPDAAAYNFINQASSQYAGIMALNVLEIPIAGWSALVKAIMDRAFTLMILIPALPVIAIIALLIKLDSPGPVFFRQQRYGFNQRLIGVYKFRSMHIGQQDENAATLVTRGDARVTRLGSLLRRTSLDELPQLFNVLKGEMSLVGPRPHALQAKAANMLYQDLVSEYAVRHKVKPGITGWAQVNGWRGETDTVEKIEKRVEHDLYYIDHWSPVFDLYILLRTLIAVVRNDNAY
jgi:Undecaprenyl-phosphate glucose phosphotransferase